MNKYIKLIMLTIISVLISISFTKLYSDYTQYKFLSSFEEYSVSFSFDYSLNEQIDGEDIINNLNDYVKDNNLVLYSFSYLSSPVFEYYNPNKLEDFEQRIIDYSRECKYKCIQMKELNFDDLDVNMFYDVYGNNSKVVNNMFEIVPEIVNISENSEESQEHSNIEFFILEYNMYFVVGVLLIFSLVFIFYLDFLKSIDRVQLHSIYGYDFANYIKYFFKKRLVKSYLYVIISSVLVTIIIQKTFGALLAITIFYIITFSIITLIVYIVSMIVYRNIRKNAKYNVVNFSVILFSLITTIFIVLTTSLLSTFIKSTIYYNNTNISHELLNDYYSVHFDQSIGFDTQIILGEELLDNYNAMSVNYLEKDLDLMKDYNTLVVDKNYLKNNSSITRDDGEKIVIDDYSKVYVLVANKDLNIKGYYNSSIFEIIYISNNNEKYNTFNHMTPYAKLNDTVIEIIFKPPLVSNVFLKASSEEEAIDIFGEVYKKYGVDEEVNINVLNEVSFKDDAYFKLISSMVASALAILSLGLVSTFYAILIFTKYSRKIILASIYGYNNFRIFKHLFKEIIIVLALSIASLALVFKLTTYEYLILLGIFAFITIVMFVKFNALLKGSIISFVKGEM